MYHSGSNQKTEIEGTQQLSQGKFNIKRYYLCQRLKPWRVWLSGLGILPQTERSQVRFPVRAHAWEWQARSSVAVVQEATNWCFPHTSMFLSLSFSLPSPLSKNKYNIYITGIGVIRDCLVRSKENCEVYGNRDMSSSLSFSVREHPWLRSGPSWKMFIIQRSVCVALLVELSANPPSGTSWKSTHQDARTSCL